MIIILIMKEMKETRLAALWWLLDLRRQEAAQRQRFSVNLIQRILRFLDVLGNPGRSLPGESAHTCAIKNQYFTADKERRACTSLGVCDPFRFEELPEIETDVYHFAGLVYGDFDGELLEEAARHGKVALDVQCMLRHVEADGSMQFHDWAEKKKYLPMIHYLKTDAAEAEILTGLTDRAEAAKKLYGWGAKEIVITHNTEVLAYDGNKIYTCPIKARNLSGRTGRGDTTFAGYIAARQKESVEDALLYCTALVSLKMETPGPFKGTKKDVLEYIHEFYK